METTFIERSTFEKEAWCCGEAGAWRWAAVGSNLRFKY